MIFSLLKEQNINWELKIQSVLWIESYMNKISNDNNRVNFKTQKFLKDSDKKTFLL